MRIPDMMSTFHSTSQAIYTGEHNDFNSDLRSNQAHRCNTRTDRSTDEEVERISNIRQSTLAPLVMGTR